MATAHKARRNRVEAGGVSSHNVEVVNIDGIEKHPNADRLDLAKIKGWQCVVGRDEYKAGDKVIYIPIDSVLSPECEKKLFSGGSKVVLHNGRVRTIKLRGQISQGMVAPLALFGLEHIAVGSNVAELIGVSKYEPPSERATNVVCAARQRPINNPMFHKYTGIENFKYWTDVFQDGEEIYVTEKIHGANFRAGWVRTHCNTLWKKIKRCFGLLPTYEFVYGSHNIQLQDKLFVKTYYKGNPYAKIVDQYNLKEVLEHGEVVYGEMYGHGIQANYTYGCGPDQHKLVVFDVKKEREDGAMRYLDTNELLDFCATRSLPIVPMLYAGPFDVHKIPALSRGKSLLSPAQRVREGCVVRPIKEMAHELYNFMGGRKILKSINDDYLLDHSNTDNK